MIKRYLFVVSLMLSFIVADAQLVHFTQDYLTPMGINPAMTGSFYGTLRGSAVLRDQDNRITSSGDEYRSLNGSVDYNLDIAFREQDWTSVGVNVARLGAGITGFVRSEYTASVAYHISMSKKRHQVFSIGFAFGNIGNSFSNRNRAEFVDENILLGGGSGIINNFFSSADPTTGRVSNNVSDYGLGIVYTAPAGRNADVRMGLSMKQVIRPRIGIENQNLERLDPEFTAFVKFYSDINKRTTFIPAILFSREGAASRFLTLSGMLSYQLQKGKDIYLNGGLGLRTANNSQDLMVLTGIDWNLWRFGLAADFNMARVASTANGFGAIELGVSKIIFIHKKPKVSPVMLCPRL